MAQDLLINKTNKTELESLNGYFMHLANAVGFDARINKKLYEICQREFIKDDFQPLEIELVWDQFKEVL